MPIKFRCAHCRQFLGIADSQAGEIVDCPTCGRSVRVPRSDGSVEPLPELRLNTGDRQLNAALQELAAIDPAAIVPLEESASDFIAEQIRSPHDADLQPVDAVAVDTHSTQCAVSAEAIARPSVKPIDLTENSSAESLTEELAQLAAMSVRPSNAKPNGKEAPVAKRRLVPPAALATRRRRFRPIVMFCLALILAFVGGYLLGWWQSVG